MTMKDTFNNLAPVVAINPQTITSTGSPQDLVSPGIDLQFFNSALVVAHIGDIDELGSSPVGSSKIEMELEDSDDDVTYTDVTLADVVGPSSVTSGIVASSTTDQTTMKCGYVGDKRYIRVRLLSTTLTNGGPVSAMVIKGNDRHAPV